MDIKQTIKGRHAWKEFEKLMLDENILRVNNFTQSIAKKKMEHKDAIKAGPELGTKEFENLTIIELLSDMETRFKNKEIKSLFDYLDLLDDHNHNLARYKIMER